MEKNLVLPMEEKYVDYLHDESRREGKADSISFPTSEEEVCEILRQMHGKGIPVTIQGSRTGLAAAAVPESGHVMNLERMNRILGMRVGPEGEKRDARCRYAHIPDQETIYVRVQPGLTLQQFRDYLRTREIAHEDWDPASLEAYRTFQEMPERYFPPDPTEGSASLGGMAACNSSGAKSFYYGPVRGYIEAVRLALADGDILSLRRGEQFADGRHFALRTEGGRLIEGDLPSYRMPDCKNAAGYFAADDMDLVDLLIGSDGTFGVFTELELRLLAMPPVIYGLNCFFQTRTQALGFSRLARLDCPRIAAVEYLDRNCLTILRKNGKRHKIPRGSECMLYLEIHADTDEDVMDEIQAVLSDIEEVGADPNALWIAEDYAGRNRMLEMRHLIPVTVNERVAFYKQTHPDITKTASDMAVPDDQFSRTLKMYDCDLEAEDFEFAVWGHFGNNHLHVNIIPHTMGEMNRAREMYARWAQKVTARGGTVSAEHGTGKIKAPLLRIMYGEEGIRGMAAVRTCFDPDGLLGRGNLF